MTNEQGIGTLRGMDDDAAEKGNGEAVWFRLPAALRARVDAEVARRRAAAGLPADAGSPSRAAVLRALVEAGLDAVAEQASARAAVSRSARRAL